MTNRSPNPLACREKPSASSQRSRTFFLWGSGWPAGPCGEQQAAHRRRLWRDDSSCYIQLHIASNSWRARTYKWRGASSTEVTAPPKPPAYSMRELLGVPVLPRLTLLLPMLSVGGGPSWWTSIHLLHTLAVQAGRRWAGEFEVVLDQVLPWAWTTRWRRSAWARVGGGLQGGNDGCIRAGPAVWGRERITGWFQCIWGAKMKKYRWTYRRTDRRIAGLFWGAKMKKYRWTYRRMDRRIAIWGAKMKKYRWTYRRTDRRIAGLFWGAKMKKYRWTYRRTDRRIAGLLVEIYSLRFKI
jgi:hypothetical protein